MFDIFTNATWSELIAFFLIVPTSIFSIFAVFRVPVYALWKLSIGYIEWGHFFAVWMLLGCLFCDLSTTQGQVLLGMAMVGIVCTLSPWWRAWMFRADVVNALERVWGKQETSPFVEGGQHHPLSWRRILSMPIKDVELTRIQIPYSTELSMPVDLYRHTSQSSGKPLLVMIHGGSWEGGDLEQLANVNRYFAARGLHVAALSYRLSPEHTYPTHAQDIQLALEWLIEHAETYGYDAQHILLAGRSAGGHLALLTGMKANIPNIRGIISFYAPTDLHWSWEHPSSPWIMDSPRILRAFLGGSPEEVPQQYEDASPILHVSSENPPVLLIHGTRDELVSYQQGRRLAQAFQEQNVPHVLLEFPWATHGCEANLSGPSGQLSLYAIERWIGAVCRDIYPTH